MPIARRIWSIPGNRQWLDGGAMFGNVPRALWQRWTTPDERHRIPLACRAMLVEEQPSGRRLLFETGIGAFFPPKLRDRFGVVEERNVLLDSLGELGLSDADVDVVVLSHLHFDHAGGLLSAYQEDQPLRLLFPRATFAVGARAWARAVEPHARDRASFIPELHDLLEASGRLELVAGDSSDTLGPDYLLHTSDGHTPGLIATEISGAHGPLVFPADMIPGRPWIHLPVTMGYDRYPERLIDEKRALLTQLAERDGRLFFTHDPEVSVARVLHRDGRFGPGECWERVAGEAI